MLSRAKIVFPGRQFLIPIHSVTLNNASDHRADGLLSHYIGWTNGITGKRG